MPYFTKLSSDRHRISRASVRTSRLVAVTPFDAPGEWLRCALHAHTTNSDGELAPDVARPALRLGRLRRPRDHRPLGADRRAVHAGPARDPLGGAERDRADPRGRRPRARPRARGRPGRARDRVRAAAGGRLAGCSRTAACPTSPTPTGAACASTSGRRARGSLGIEVWNTGCELELGRGDASLHWDEALERGRCFFALATDDSHHPGYDSGFAWTWVRARGADAGRRARRAARRARSTARPGRGSTRSR